MRQSREKNGSSCLSHQKLICYPLFPWPHTAGGHGSHRLPLSPPCLSLSHTLPGRSRWQLTPLRLSSHHPSLFSPHGWDEKWLSSIISMTDSPTDLLSACKPSLLEFMEQIKCSVKLHFTLNSAKSHPAFSWNGELWLRSDRAHYLISPNLIGCGAVRQWSGCGGRKYLHMWVWLVQRYRAWLVGQYWCMMCKAFNVNRGWRGKGNVPIQISITLSSSPCCLVAMTSWWTRLKTGGNDWFLMWKQWLPGACGSHISKQAVSGLFGVSGELTT